MHKSSFNNCSTFLTELSNKCRKSYNLTLSNLLQIGDSKYVPALKKFDLALGTNAAQITNLLKDVINAPKYTIKEKHKIMEQYGPILEDNMDIWADIQTSLVDDKLNIRRINDQIFIKINGDADLINTVDAINIVNELTWSMYDQLYFTRANPKWPYHRIEEYLNSSAHHINIARFIPINRSFSQLMKDNIEINILKQFDSALVEPAEKIIDCIKFISTYENSNSLDVLADAYKSSVFIGKQTFVLEEFNDWANSWTFKINKLIYDGKLRYHQRVIIIHDPNIQPDKHQLVVKTINSINQMILKKYQFFDKINYRIPLPISY